ncbi:MAG: outer membrane beta-barrel protein [Acidobacteriota bacterium]|nr:MAG: outer membrane beta-barrel protein [Acidobacteriota bacterium]
MKAPQVVFRLCLFPILFSQLSPSVLGQAGPSQEWVYRGEIFGSLGWEGFYHGKHHEFTGLDLGGGISFRPFKGALSGLGLETRFSYLDSSSQEYGDIKRLTGDLLYHFGQAKVQPFVLGGLGKLWGRRTVTVLYGSGPDDYREEYYEDYLDKFGIEFGVGLKIALTRHLVIRPEFRCFDTTPGSGYNLSLPQLSVAAGYWW